MISKILWFATEHLSSEDTCNNLNLKTENDKTCAIKGELKTCISSENLLEFIQKLIPLFEISNNEHSFSLHDALVNDWPLFKDTSAALNVLKELKDDKLQELLNAKSICYVKDVNNVHEEWDNFEDEIKTKWRFFPDAEVLSDYIEHWDELTVSFDRNTLYRARINIHEPFDRPYRKDEMGMPPREVTRDGRLNPVGIPALYLADDILTCLCEIRANSDDYVTIGTFEIKAKDNEFRMLDLANPILPVYSEAIDVLFVKKRIFIRKLVNAFSKPMTRYNSPLDYLPTQYWAERIRKELDVKILKYNSSQYKGGTNYVAFEENIFNCTHTCVVHVECDRNYTYSPLSANS